MRCYFCGQEFNGANVLRYHNYYHEANIDCTYAPYYEVHTFNLGEGWRASEYVRLYGEIDFTDTLNSALDDLKQFTHQLLEDKGYRLRFNIQVYAELGKPNPDGFDDVIRHYFTSFSKIPITRKNGELCLLKQRARWPDSWILFNARPLVGPYYKSFLRTRISLVTPQKSLVVVAHYRRHLNVRPEV